MKLSIRLRNALVFAFLMVSMLVPAKMGMGQRFFYKTSWGTEGKNNSNIVRPGSFLLLQDGSVLINNNNGANANIMRLSQSGELIGTIGTSGTGLGQLQWPMGMEQLSNGDILVGDYWTERIQVFGLDGTYKYQFTGVDGVHPAFGRPHGISVDAEDNVFVVGENAGIWVYRPDGTYVRHWSTTQYGVWIEDVVHGPDGNLYVSFPNGQGVVVMTTHGQYVRTIDGTLTGGPRFSGVIGLRFDTSGLLYITDTLAPKIRVFTPDGHEVASFGEAGTGITKISRPLQSQPLPNGTVLVSEENNSTILVFQQEQTPPTSTFSASPSTAWSNTNVLATITSTDNVGGFGVKEIHYSINMGAEQIVSSSTASFTLTDNGTTSISYFAVDNVGNTETAKLATVKIDKIAPVATLSQAGGLITLSATDAHSGVAKINYQINGGAVVDYSAPFADTIHKVTYWAEDVATNIETAKTDIINAGVQSVSVTQNRILGGIGVVGTVTLDKAAGVGGTVVKLASSLPGVAVVDATVIVPEGATTASFDIDANPVAVDTTVSITASIFETSQSALVTVQAPMPSSVTWSTSPVVGGSSTTGTVTLTSPAPAGGTTVSLASSSLSAVVASSVTIPAGAMTATFTASTNVVSNDTSAVISATVYGAKLKSTLSILGPKVSSVTLASATVASLGTTTGTVTLSTNAPVGGKVVNISSSNAAVASVPVSVTVAAGTKTATFTVTAGSVTANTSATISATTNGSSGTATVTVNTPPAAISGITTNVAAVTGGLSVTGTVTLTNPAPTGGAVIVLASSPTTAGTVPASVTVAAGSTSATFTITTKTVTTVTTLTVTGSYLGVAKVATVTVNPARVVSTLTLNPTSVKGGTNSTVTITLTGVATEAVVVTLTSGTITVATVPASVTVPAGASSVTFTITTLAQTATKTSIITAKTGTTSKTATLSVTK